MFQTSVEPSLHKSNAAKLSIVQFQFANGPQLSPDHQNPGAVLHIQLFTLQASAYSRADTRALVDPAHHQVWRAVIPRLLDSGAL
jgi:hypothetical protein